MEGLKFKYLSFNKIREDYNGISVWIDGKEVAFGEIGSVLNKLLKREDAVEIPNYKIKTTRPYFDIFVIELTSE